MKALLEEARGLTRRFEKGTGRQLTGVLKKLSKQRFEDAASLLDYHETLLYGRAYPHEPAVVQLTEELLAGIGEKVAELEANGAELELLDRPEASGVHGSRLVAIFSLGVARRLAKLFGEDTWLALEWADFSPGFEPLLGRLAPLAEEDLLVEPVIPYGRWAEAVLGPGGRPLCDVVAALDASALREGEKEAYFRLASLPVECTLRKYPFSRTGMRAPCVELFYQKAPLIKRSELCFDRELAEGSFEIEKLDRESGQAFLNFATVALAVRQRELHGFTYGDPDGVVRARLGRGVEAFLCGLAPGWRLPLRAYHGAMLVRNGVPVGYFEGLSFFERMDVGFNIFYTFRDGESAWLLARLLGLMHQMLGVKVFFVDPYQIGYHNEEAIESGAFWFYRKLGFRPTRPEVVRVMQREECKLMKKPGHLSPRATLRRLAAGSLVYEMEGAEKGRWDEFRLRELCMAASRTNLASAPEVASALGIRAGAHPEFNKLAQVLALIPDLAQWTKEEKGALVQWMRFKIGGDEARYLEVMQKHARLREALLKLGSQPAQRGNGELRGHNPRGIYHGRPSSENISGKEVR